jgi:NAD(P)-dependent dehydrogenase (short-subunit alcohol dehydrogenase family)
MTKTILICGLGPGISTAVAKKFGKAGFAVGVVARSADKVAAAAKALVGEGVKAAGYVCDLSDAAAVTAMVGRVRRELGAITVLHWNAYPTGAGDLTVASSDEVRKALDVGVTGMVAAVQAALPDLRQQKGTSAVLITGGGLALYGPKIDAMATSWGVMSLAVVKAAQHKLAGLFAEKLRADGIYVGEVVVTGLVKGTAFDSGNATLEPSAIADKFFELYSARTAITANL